MTETKVYVLPVVQTTDSTTGEEVSQPKYVDRKDVEGFNGSLISKPPDFPGFSNVSGQVYVASVTAEEPIHDEAIIDVDTWLVGESERSTVTPEQLAEYLNDEFRIDLSGITEQAVVQAFEELSEQLGPEYRRLTPEEWANRLGFGTGAFD
jgi:hypothetical protein